jgi:hypothetical protein
VHVNLVRDVGLHLDRHSISLRDGDTGGALHTAFLHLDLHGVEARRGRGLGRVVGRRGLGSLGRGDLGRRAAGGGRRGLVIGPKKQEKDYEYGGA